MIRYAVVVSTTGSSADRLEAHLKGLFAFAFSLTRDSDTAKDLVQDTAERSIKAKEVPDDHAAYKVWLFRILRNAWIDKVRRQRFEVVVGEMPEPDVIEVRHEERRIVDTLSLRRAFMDLSDDHRTILSLVDVTGLTYDEAAETLSVPRGTVMSRVARARKALAALMAEPDNVTPLPTKRCKTGIT